MHFFSCSSSFLFLSCPLLFCFLLIAHFFHLCSLLTTLAHCNLSLAPICHHLILFIVNQSYLLSFSPVHYWMLVIACAYLLTIEYLPLLVLTCSLLLVSFSIVHSYSFFNFLNRKKPNLLRKQINFKNQFMRVTAFENQLLWNLWKPAL
jgi:hypothetical protein